MSINATPEFRPSASLAYRQGSLSTLMKEACKQKHEQVSRLPIILAIRDGAISKTAYAQYITDLYHIYNALERRIREYELDLRIRPLMIPELFRTQKLLNDAVFLGCNLKTATLSAKLYVEHLQKLPPHLLIAHTRSHYLGGLYEGHRYKYKVSYAFGEQAATFYDFKEALACFDKGTPQSVAIQYELIINQLPLNGIEKDQIIQESTIAYEYLSNWLSELQPF